MGEPGGNLTVIYSSEYAAPKATSRPTAILPLLVILFVVSYGILTMLVFEQGQTIESQRTLIREMLKDSTQLAALKGKLARDDSKRPHDNVPVQADQQDAASQGNAAQGTATQGNHAAANSAAPQKGSTAKGAEKDTKQPGKSAHATKEVPGKPAADLEDVRRYTRVI
jgi:hypothetical protein